MIAFLHTSDIHIDKFEKLVRKIDKHIVVKHFVNDRLLSSALENGVTDSVNFSKEVSKIFEFQPKLIVCTCSTYGEECDRNDKIQRIDYPIAAYLVSNFKKIGLAYTANSTKEASENLLLTIAEKNNKKITIRSCDCSSAWKYYESNDFENYEKSIAYDILPFENEVDVIFLAQASMEGCKQYLLDFSKSIYSSPEFGVEKYLKETIL